MRVRKIASAATESNNRHYTLNRFGRSKPDSACGRSPKVTDFGGQAVWWHTFSAQRSRQEQS